MKNNIIKDYKDKNNIELIQKCMEENNGYITSKQVSDIGIHRMYLNIMKTKRMIDKVGNGIYIDSRKIQDNYFIFSMELPNVIFSHMTALYFHGLSIKAPDNVYDVTVCNNYFNYKLKKHNVFYVNKEILELGITEIKSPMGNSIRLYDVERCICDIIRSKNRMDLEHIKYSIRDYLKRKDKDIIKLSEYATIMGIKDEVMDFVGMLYE